MKRNWIIAFTVVMLLTLSCRLPFSQSSQPVDQTISGDEVMNDENLIEEVVLDEDFFDEGVYFVSPEGVTVVVPPGGLNLEGEPKQISVTILDGEHPNLPEGFVQVGDVFVISAGSDPLLQPVMLSLAIPPDVPHDEIIGLTTYSEEQGSWVLVPSFVDSESGVVTTSVPGFSRWSIARIGTLSAHCSYYHVGPQCYAQEKGAWIEVTNQHIFNQGINPPLSGARYNHYTTNYGVCIRRYELDDPSAAQSWRHLQDWCLTVSDYASSRTGSVSTMRWLLPAGRYELVEYVFASERNPGVPDYVPEYGTNYRPMSTLVLRDGQTASFSNNGNFSGWLGWGETFIAESSDSEPSSDPTEAINTLPWWGFWQGKLSVDSIDCQGPYYEIVCGDGSKEASVNSHPHNFYIPEDNDLIPDVIQAIVDGFEWPLTIEMEYPTYVYSVPFTCRGDTCVMGNHFEGSYNETMDNFTGTFVWSEYHYETGSHVILTGTWIATRQD